MKYSQPAAGSADSPCPATSNATARSLVREFDREVRHLGGAPTLTMD
jgi:hypothetical protein